MILDVKARQWRSCAIAVGVNTEYLERWGQQTLITLIMVQQSLIIMTEVAAVAVSATGTSTASNEAQ